MTSLRMFRRWKSYLLGATLLQAVVIMSTSGEPCTPEKACYPASVQLANVSFPLRQLNVSSSCGADNSSTPYCSPEDSLCSADSPQYCTAGEYTAELMLDWTTSADSVNPDYTTYWQSENSVAATGAEPTTQYVEVSSHLSRYIIFKYGYHVNNHRHFKSLRNGKIWLNRIETLRSVTRGYVDCTSARSSYKIW